MSRVFTGFGFGPIQSGLFILEAYRTGRYSRLVVAEVDAALCEAVRANGGRYCVNIAHADRIETVIVEGVTLLNPTLESDRKELVNAIAESDEAATALPSIGFYAKGVASVIAEGLSKRHKPPLIIYAAENHNHAAEAMEDELGRCGGVDTASYQAVNTVIGKMSGVVTDQATISRLGLATLTPGTARAVLAEAFNRILISKITRSGVSCGISCLVEKTDLLPFEEAKLYGHNAIHALIGYLAHARGLTTMDQARAHDDIMAIARGAFLDECGEALIRKYGGLDPLFTREGWRVYAEDLLERMTNPYLHDLVSRVIRDPQRKLGWDDRIYGTLRLALSQGVIPRHLARGAAEAVRMMCEGRSLADRDALAVLLRGLWSNAGVDEANRLIDLTWEPLRDA